MSLDELASNPAHYDVVRDLILSEQVCPTRVALLLRQHPDLRYHMIECGVDLGTITVS